MSKGKKRGAPAAAEVIQVRTLREQRWAYEQRRKRMRWDQIADLAMRPPAEGGLGYARSPKALKAAYAVHVAEVVELEEASRPESTVLALATLDAVERELYALAGPVDHARTEQAKAKARAEGDLSDDEVEAIVVLRPEAERRDALKTVLATHDRRSKLLGLDAPIVLDVTHHDATIADLNDALGRLGETPVKTSKKVDR